MVFLWLRLFFQKYWKTGNIKCVRVVPASLTLKTLIAYLYFFLNLVNSSTLYTHNYKKDWVSWPRGSQTETVTIKYRFQGRKRNCLAHCAFFRANPTQKQLWRFIYNYLLVDMVNMSYLSERDSLITFIRYLHTPKERLQEHDTTEIPDKVVLQSTTEIYHQKLCRPMNDVFTWSKLVNQKCMPWEINLLPVITSSKISIKVEAMDWLDIKP